MHVAPSRRSNSWSSGITLSIGGWALTMVLKGMGAVIVAFAAVTFIHVSVVVSIVALTAVLPFRILIPTSNIGRINLLLHWCCIEDFQVFCVRVCATDYVYTAMWRRGNPAGLVSCCAGDAFGVRSDGLGCVCFEQFERRTHHLHVYIHILFLLRGLEFVASISYSSFP